MEATKNHISLCQFGEIDIKSTWNSIFSYASEVAAAEPYLRPLLEDVILSRTCIGSSISARLARKLAREDMGREEIEPILKEVYVHNSEITLAVLRDMLAIEQRDPACQSALEPLLFFKGFLAISTYRAAHYLWKKNRKPLALYFQSICSEAFAVDIHPAARIGCGILLDHATSFVVGETAIVEDNVSILHEVTLGGTGKATGDRHPIVRSGVLIGAGAKLLGRIEIGECAKIGAGSVVLSNVPTRTTVAGVPAKIVGHTTSANPAMEMNQSIDCKYQSLESANI